MTATPRAHALHRLFEDWVASRPGRGPRAGNGALSPSSAQLYRDMWAVFTQFLLSRRLRGRPTQAPDPTGLSLLRPSDLAAFLEAAQPPATGAGGWSHRYTWRMLHLIDRVLRFHALRDGGVRATPAASLAADALRQSAVRFAHASGLDHAPTPLDGTAVRRLRRQIEHASRQAAADPAGQRWRTVRDAAMVALMLGSGLAPGDVQALAAAGIDLPAAPPAAGVVRIPADGVSPAHEAPLAGWAVPVIERWLALRAHRGVTGHHAFPSTLKGTPMSRMSLHRRVVGLMAEAGIDGGVPFRLRHTFAVTQLAAGVDEVTVSRWLGLVESKAIQRYVELARARRRRRRG